MNVFAIGTSKNIGYFAVLRLLNQGATVTYLLRSPNVFDNDAAMLPFIKDGKAKLVHGDDLKAETIRDGWATALEAGNGKVDVVLFTLGGLPTFSITRGFVFDPAHLVTRSLLNTFGTMPAHHRHLAQGTPTRAQAALRQHAQRAARREAQRVLAHVCGILWTGFDQVKREVLVDGWQDAPGLPAEGEIRQVVVIRPALLTDGECRGDRDSKKGKAPYRALKDGDFGDGYHVSRKDVAHFIICDALPNWEQWEGSGVTVAY